MRSSVSELFQDFVTLIYPRYCLACQDGLIKGEDILCTKCIHELPRTNYHKDLENPVFKRLYGRLPIRFALAFLLFKKGGRVQRLLHELKYNNHPEIGQLLGRVYGNDLQNEGFGKHLDIILPIPLHPVKQKRRRYNQSAEFAKGLSQSLNVGYSNEAIKRIIVTETQTRKSKLRRWENVKEVFSVANNQLIEGKRVLLVDDVITTGATIEACGQVLIDAGIQELSVASIAYTEE